MIYIDLVIKILREKAEVNERRVYRAKTNGRTLSIVGSREIEKQEIGKWDPWAIRWAQG